MFGLEVLTDGYGPYIFAAYGITAVVLLFVFLRAVAKIMRAERAMKRYKDQHQQSPAQKRHG